MDLFLGTIAYLLIFVYFKKRSKYFSHIKKIVFLAIGVRYFFALYHWYIGPFPIIGVLPDSGSDEILFLSYAKNFASNLAFSWKHLFSINLYPTTLGLIFKFFGAHNFIGSALNSFFGIIVLLNVYRIYNILWGRIASKKAVWIFLLLPMQAVYSVLLIREAMFTYFLTACIYYFLSWYFVNKQTKFLYFSFLYLLLAIFLHDAVVTILIPMIYFLLRKRSSKFSFNKTFLILLITSLIFSGSILNYSLKNIEEAGFNLKVYENVRSQLIEKNRQFSYANESDNFIKIFLNFTLRPFIWEYQVGILRIFNTLLVYTLVYLMFLRFWYIRKNMRSKMLLIFSITLLITFAIGSGDLYQSDRHRSKVLPLLIALVPYKKNLI